MIKTVVFDKTGTLTDEDLKVLGHRAVFTSPQNQIKFGCLTDDIIYNNDSSQLKTAMACCQTTKKIGDKLIGNPHDIKIFEYIGWEQTDKLNDRNGYAYTIIKPSDLNLPIDKDSLLKFEVGVEIKVLKQYEFQSKLQRMSVVCINQDLK